MSSSLPNGISSLKLKVSTYEQVIAYASVGSNSIKVTEQNILTALQSGDTINPSMAVTYNNAAFSSGTGTGNVDVAGTPYVPPPPTTWVQRGADIDGEANNDYSGHSVSLSSDGTIVAIGAIFNAGGGYNLGHVRVYKLIGATWVQRGADIDGEAHGGESGFSVSLSSDGTIVAIGAIKSDLSRGHVSVYAWNGATWVKRGANIVGEANNNKSGHSVSLSSDGTIVAIGAIDNAGGGGSYRGHVRVYQYDATKTTAVTDQSNADFGPIGWRRLGADIDGEADYDFSGSRVSLSSDGTIVAFGATQNAGHVSVYAWNGATWVKRGANIVGEANNDESGHSVSLSSNGSIVAIGATKNAAGRGIYIGHVRVYVWNVATSTWVQRGADIDGEAGYDESGHSVSLSTDGSIVAIGAPYNAGGGSYRGHVRVYVWSEATTTWVQRGADIDGEANNDESGHSVSLSSNGSIVAIGTPYNAGGGTRRGHVRVYKYQ
jgi:hypothetical protein